MVPSPVPSPLVTWHYLSRFPVTSSFLHPFFLPPGCFKLHGCDVSLKKAGEYVCGWLFPTVLPGGEWPAFVTGSSLDFYSISSQLCSCRAFWLNPFSAANYTHTADLVKDKEEKD